MFGPFKVVRKVFAQLKSDMTPAQISIGASLGVVMGLTPAGLHWLPILLLVFLINCSMASFLLSFAIFKGVFLAIAPFSFQVGTSLLSGPGASQSLVAALYEAPVFAFLGYNNYLVFGSYVVALAIALIFYPIFLLLVRHYRNTFVAKLNQSEKYQKLSQKRLFRLGRWFFTGKEKKEFAEKKKRFILLRPFRAYMAVFVPLLAVGLWLGAGIYVTYAIEGLAVGALNRSMGVKTTFGDISYGFFGQQLSFQNFEMPDPKDTMQNVVQVGEFDGDVSFLDLLAGRLRVEKLVLRDVRFSARRDKDGKLNLTELPGAQPDEEAAPGEQEAWREYLEWLQEKGNEADWADLWKRYVKYREKAARERAEKEAAPKPEAEPLLYDPDLCWKPKRTRPLFSIDDLELSGFQLSVEDEAGPGLPSLTDLSGKGLSISTMPGWDGNPMKLDLAGKLDGGKSGAIDLTFSKASPLRGKLKIDGVPVAALRSLYEKQIPVNVKKGTASFVLEGMADTAELKATAALSLEELKIARQAGQSGLLGMDAETSQYVEMGLNSFGENGVPLTVALDVGGTPAAPEFEARAAFLEAARDGLKKAGRKELEKYIKRIDGEVEEIQAEALKRIDPLKGEAGKTIDALKKGDIDGAKGGIDKAKDALDKARDTDDLKDKVKGFKDIFKKKDDDKKEDGKKDKKDSVKDALDLFGGSKKK